MGGIIGIIFDGAKAVISEMMKSGMDVTAEKAILWADYKRAFHNSEFADLLDVETLDDYFQKAWKVR